MVVRRVYDKSLTPKSLGVWTRYSAWTTDNWSRRKSGGGIKDKRTCTNVTL